MSASFLEFVLEQLGKVESVSHRRMFGGVGLYARGHFFGLIDNDTLFFRVNDITRAEYEKLGARPFQPFGEGTKPMSGYFELPGDVMESGERLAAWMQAAIRVAESAPTTAKAKRSSAASLAVPSTGRPAGSAGRRRRAKKATPAARPRAAASRTRSRRGQA
ncbi:MAG: TfoX/Sxy family protein [Verrucomicrobiales bacterium]|nr:TfoX/Sxy family protein [Verrucomicrobiales bacterium]